jgi:hypothetical protein
MAGTGPATASRYLSWLAEQTDYPLSDIEAEVAAHATGQAAAGPSEPAGEAGPGAAQPDVGGDPVTGPGGGESEPERDSADHEQA